LAKLCPLADRIGLAEKDELPLQDVLLGLFSDEVERRRDASTSRRAHDAGLGPDMLFERWDKSAKVSYDRRVLQELVSLRFVEAQRNVVVLGPVGVGKTFIANALGHVACRCGFNVILHRGDELLRLLRQSRLDNSREVLMTELCTIDLLIIDDFALEPMTRDESRDIYQLIYFCDAGTLKPRSKAAELLAKLKGAYTHDGQEHTGQPPIVNTHRNASA
jgi:DNA replication protein DnaC